MTIKQMTKAFVGSVAAIGLSLNIAAAEPAWPDLPVGVKNGVSARVGDTIYVGLGSAGTAFYSLDLKEREKGWVTRSPFPGPATNGAAVATSNGQIFVFSGNGKPALDAKSPIIFNTIYSYDPASDSWQSLDTTTPVGLSGAKAISLPDGRIAVVGGYNKELFDKYLSDVSAIDKEKFPADFAKLVTSYMSMEPKDYRWNGKILAFDPAAKHWRELGESPFLPNCDAAVVSIDQNTFFIISGEIKPGLRTPNVKSITFVGGRVEWRQLADLPKPAGDVLQEGVAGAYAGSVGDTVLVAGGANFKGARARAEAGHWFAHEGLSKAWRTHVYSLKDGNWMQVGELPAGLAYGASFSMPKGILIVGGEDNAGNARRDVFLLKWDGRSVSVEE
ncbi:N-acetylneuraminate epimerase [Microvirga arabica]|uniref:N-acetylneuraminate epimerase n=1 Tax=Microvirga arabica TaxID=1128671 RepID=UPI0019398C99|nr:N-acetylneuraminate epimerase [Microvirga arabica]MBM1173647.1 N-acetylneuraminate epimerase [Microvirga arabica]